MTINAGDVKATFSGDAAGFTSAADKARAALSNVGAEADKTAKKLDNAKPEKFATATKQAAETAQKLSSGMSALGAESSKFSGFAMGAAGAAQGMAESFKSGGLGAAAATGAIGLAVVALQLLNTYIAEQDALSKKLDDTWSGLTKKAGELRTAADLANQAQADQIALNERLAGASTSHDARVIQASAPALKAEAAAIKEINAERKALVSTIQALARASGDTAKNLEVEKQAHQSNIATLKTVAATQHDIANKSEELVTSQEKAEKAAKLRSEHEAASAQWLAKQAALLAAAGDRAMYGVGNGTSTAGAPASPSGPWDAYAAEDALAAAHGDKRGTLPGMSVMGGFSGELRPGAMQRGVASAESAFSGEDGRDLGTKIGQAFADTGVEVFASGLSSGGVLGAFEALGSLAGAAAGIPFAGAIIGGIEQGVGMLVKAFADFGEMLGRIPGQIFSGTAFGAASAQLGADAGTVATNAGIGAGIGGAAGGILGGPMFGTVGVVVGTAAGAAVAGGATAAPAIVDFVLQLSMATPAFERFSTVMRAGAERLIAPLSFIWDALLPVAGVFAQLGEILAPVVDALIQLVPMRDIAGLMVEGVKFMASALLNGARSLLDFMGALDFVRNKIPGMLSDEDYDRNKAARNTARGTINEALNKLDDVTGATGMDAAEALLRVAETGKQTAAALASINQEATNLPAGYRTEGAIFRSSPTEGGGGGRTVINNFNGAIYLPPTQYRSLESAINRRGWSAAAGLSLGRMAIPDARN